MPTTLNNPFTLASLTVATLWATAPALAQTPPAPEAATATPEAPAIPAWLNKISFGGDLRLRGDQVTDAGATNTAAVLRARLAAIGKINDDFTANMRLATGTLNNATSSNQILGGGMGKKAILLDIASVDWKAWDGLIVTGGKATNPFYTAAKNELIWDSDLTFEGFNAKWALELGELKPFLTLSYNTLNDPGNATADTTLVGAQAGLAYKGEGLSGTLAVSSYTYNNLKDQPFSTTAAPTSFTQKGNSGTTAYIVDYKLLAVDAEVSLELAGIPFTPYGTYITNSDGGDFKEGLLGGLRIGKVKDVGSWAFDYSYRDLQKDATVGHFTDSDFSGGGTDVRGSQYALQYVAATGTTLAAKVIAANKAISGANTNYERYQLDAVFSF